MKITKLNSEEYDWGEKCKGWHLVNTDELSVIQEIMPKGTREVKHKHQWFVQKNRSKFGIKRKKS